MDKNQTILKLGKQNYVALFCNTLNGGGAERVMVTLANGFVQRGLKVDFLLCQKVGSLLEELNSSVRIIDLKTSRTRNVIFKLARFLFKNKPDVLLSTQTHINITSVLANWLSFKSTKNVIREASTPSIANHHHSYTKQPLLRNIYKKIYRSADAIVSVSFESRKDIVKYYELSESKIYNIYNPIYSTQLINKSLEPVAHDWLNDKSKRVIIGMGRIATPKNFPNLVRAFALVHQQMSNSRLMILGSKRPRFVHVYEEVCSVIEQNGLQEVVDLCGFVSNPFAYLSKAALFVLSSDWEGLPGSLIQALSCGCPVVSTKCKSGPTEILENGKYGRLVETNNAPALADAIRMTLENPPDRSVLVQRGQFFDVDNAVESYIELFHKVI
ncbi:MAG: glycosyltransferase [Bacteroidota bacterium]